MRPQRLVALALSVSALAIAACSRGEGDQTRAKGALPPAVAVLAAPVEARDVPVEIQGIGNVQASATVSLYSLLSGQIFEVRFKEGQDVKAGDLLFTVDPRPFDAALQQAQATMAQHQAAVAQAEANLARDQAVADNAHVEEGRYKKLSEGGLIAREQYDQINTALKSAMATIDADRAAVANARALVQADAAAVENAKVQLSYTKIRAPIEGRTGNLLIHQGNVVKANDIGNPLVVINRVHPINVVFSVPERFLDQIKAEWSKRTLPVEATPQGQTVTTRGTLSFVNNTVDMTTGTIQLKATFENQDNALWPGQFATVTLRLRTESNAIVVPSQAIQSGQQGQYVFVIKPDSTVESRPVVVAFATGPLTVVRQGVRAGERVVTDGQLRLVPGARVDVKTAGSTSPAAPPASPGSAPTSPAHQPRASANQPRASAQMTTDLFIRRPVMTTLLMAGLLIFGAMAYRQLSVSDLPNVDFPTIQVAASLPGASPDTMASAVATPLERQFSTIAGIDSMTSTSALGLTQITVQFTLDRNIDAAAQDIQAAIAAAAPLLPPGMPTPPSYKKVNPADQPVLYLALSSPTLPLYTVDEYAQTILAQRISTISGVAQVQVFGSQKYAVRVQLDPRAMATLGIGIDEVQRALAQSNVNLPTGTIYGQYQSFNVQATGQLTDAAAYRPLIVAYRGGSPIRLEQLGRVMDSVQTDKVASWYNDERSVILAIQRQPGTNTIEVVDSIKKILPTFQAQLPASINLNILYDRSVSIRASVGEVQFTLLLAVALVVLVIFLFLRNVSATVIPSLALPMSIVGTFAGMYALGYTIDNLSLMALTLAVGFVVDDAIVVLENIVRHMENGMPRFEAALLGSREIGFTIVSMTLSLAAVFIPVLFMGGVVGRLLHEFAAVIAIAVIVSGVVSLTLTPMLCSRFLKPPAASHGRIYRASERVFDGMLALYRRTLEVVLRHPQVTVAIFVATLVGTAGLFMVISKGFIPDEDTGQIFAFTEAAQDISFDSMMAHQRQAAAIVLAQPYVTSFMSSIGASNTSVVPNTGRLFIRLKPRAERPGVDEIMVDLRKKLSGIPGLNVYPQKLPTIRIGGNLTKAAYQYTLQDADATSLYKWAPVLQEKIRQQPGFLDVNSDLQITSPQVLVEIDRDRASALGVTAAQIEGALNNAYGAPQISTIFTPTNQYWVMMELLPQFKDDPDALGMLYIRSNSGKLVPLSAVAKLTRTVGPLTVNHLGQLPAVTISFNLKPGVALGDAVSDIRGLERELRLPATLTTTFQGTAQAFQSSVKGLGILLLAAILVIYLILGILYESFIHPLTILSGLPSAGVGALLTLLIFHQELNLYGFVGIIMLVGIVKKNAIMMIDFAIVAQREGKSPREAIFEGCLLRFRPIMMTTMAALMATLPIAVGIGGGGDARRSLGLSVVGGLILSQILTLYITPVIYLGLEGVRERAGGWRDVWHRMRGAQRPSPSGDLGLPSSGAAGK